jgi:hypothetical protein
MLLILFYKMQMLFLAEPVLALAVYLQVVTGHRKATKTKSGVTAP